MSGRGVRGGDGGWVLLLRPRSHGLDRPPDPFSEGPMHLAALSGRSREAGLDTLGRLLELEHLLPKPRLRPRERVWRRRRRDHGCQGDRC